MMPGPSARQNRRAAANRPPLISVRGSSWPDFPTVNCPGPTAIVDTPWRDSLTLCAVILSVGQCPSRLPQLILYPTGVYYLFATDYPCLTRSETRKSFRLALAGFAARWKL